MLDGLCVQISPEYKNAHATPGIPDMTKVSKDLLRIRFLTAEKFELIKSNVS